jgi:hypothetical protein
MPTGWIALVVARAGVPNRGVIQNVLVFVTE